MTGSALVELFANVSMTDEETAVFDEIRKDDNSKRRVRPLPAGH